ncbi:MAG TPA: SMC-Scp complex subunit ScpB [Clostridiales bacterium UBA8960]|nr:SMC-Scp complex subunit ScpB [Clostridiales bacterium UBA8960]
MDKLLVGDDHEHLKYQSIIESLLFAWAEPLSLYKIAKIIDLKPQTVEKIMNEMILIYKQEQRGIQIIETNKHYQYCTLKDNYTYVEQLCATSKSKGLSNSALEVLAIIAYKQPITKLDIEQIRGVNSEGPLQSLIERELVEIKGKLEKIGRPQIYGTTDVFLKSFGFKSLGDLPEVEAFNGFKEVSND